MNILKSKRAALMMSNLAGMISGIAIGAAGTCMLKRYYKNRNSLKSRAKKAFKTIEDTIAM